VRIESRELTPAASGLLTLIEERLRPARRA